MTPACAVAASTHPARGLRVSGQGVRDQGVARFPTPLPRASCAALSREGR